MKTHNKLTELIHELKKAQHTEKTPMWGRIANDLEMTSNRKRAVNLSRINHFTKTDEIVIVPGKVLGSGELNHKLTIVAFNFSESAKEKINKSNSKAIEIKELLKTNPKAKGVRIIG